jgi:hypothetical protein
VVGCYECGDEPLGSCAMELVIFYSQRSNFCSIGDIVILFLSVPVLSYVTLFSKRSYLQQYC